MKLTLHKLSLIAMLTLLAAAMTGCGLDPNTDVGDPAADEAQPEEAAAKPTTQSVCPTWVSLAGWYRSRKQSSYLCYYAEMTQCGTYLYAYNKRVSTGNLQTWSGLQFAYACQYAVSGEQYNGQWAIGINAGPIDKHIFSGWSGVAYNPKDDPSSAY
jgi:hypothetical protein